MDSTQDRNSTPRHESEGLAVVLVTVPNQETAMKIAHGLVSGRLAACVNVLPSVTSVYEWKGEVTQDSELLCIAKTRPSLLADLARWVQEHHPYEVPEVVALDAAFVHKPYLAWALEATKEQDL